VTYSVHLVTRPRSDRMVDEAILSDTQTGVASRVVLLHDAVLQPGVVNPAGDHVVHVGAEDCRRRGIPVPPEAVSYDELAELIAGAERVVSW
jgi:hypothetical protein